MKKISIILSSVLVLAGLLSFNQSFAALEDIALNYHVDSRPNSVVLGDFNEDGTMDLAIANSEGMSVSILIGNTNGTFDEQVSYPTTYQARFIATKDLDEDGYLDLIVGTGEGSDSSIAVLFGNGDGTFGSVVDYATSQEVNAVALGDFNEDGILDLITVMPWLQLEIRLGNITEEAFTFGPATAFGSTSIKYSLTQGDFNNDGNIDLAFASRQYVEVYLGSGDGTFADVVTYEAGAEETGITSGDFNTDGYIDLAVSDADGNIVSILLNDGIVLIEEIEQVPGTFTLHETTYDVGKNPQFLTTALINDDAFLDLIVANRMGNSVSILLGNDDGTFEEAVDYVTGTWPKSVAVYDFNSDTYLDLAVVNQKDGTVSILPGNGDGTFIEIDISENYLVYEVGDKPNSIDSGDLNGDGIIDLVTANEETNNVSVLIGTGDGEYEGAVDYSVSVNLDPEPNDVHLADFNDDGFLDIVSANDDGNSISVLFGNGDGTFGEYTEYPTGFYTVSVTSGDFDGDGYLDIAAVHDDWSDGSQFSVFINGGEENPGIFAEVVGYKIDDSSNFYVVSVDKGDFDGDGYLDLVGVTQGSEWNDSYVYILYGNGNGTFAIDRENQIYEMGTLDLSSVFVGDYNEDDSLDLAITSADDNTVLIMLNQGDGTFSEPDSYTVGFNPHEVSSADLDNDGHLDLLVANRQSGSISLLLGNGDGTFGEKTDYKVGDSPKSVTIADLDGDGDLDFATANFFSNNVSVVLLDIIPIPVRPTPSVRSSGSSASSQYINLMAMGNIEQAQALQQQFPNQINPVAPPVVNTPNTTLFLVVTRTLKQGTTGQDTKQLQTILNNLGYDTGTPDGIFGPKTKQAVINFQKANNLIPDGVVGPQTIQTLNNQTPTVTPTTTTQEESIPLLSLTRTLKQGMQGEDVKQLQIYLNTHNHPVSIEGDGSLGKETTYFGSKTKQAVINFQKANNLIPDGIVGSQTRGMMR